MEKRAALGVRRQVAILTGGESSEREIALRSAKVVADLLKNTYDVFVFDFPSDVDLFISGHKTIDVAIPVFHGKGGEDGSIQGFLHTLGIPFLFSDIEAQAIGLNKVQTKRIVAYCDIATPDFQVIKKNELIQYEFPCVIKPVDGGSSIGVSLAQSEADFLEGIKAAFIYSDTLLIEKYISGEEYTVAVIEENGQAVALPVIQYTQKRSSLILKASTTQISSKKSVPRL